MRYRTLILLFSVLTGMISCTENWDEHYINPDTVNQNVWEAVQNNPEYSEFVKAIKDLHYDTIFQSDISYSLFVPNNNAFNQYNNEITDKKQLISYHITPHFIQLGNIQGKRKIQTLGEKYALFEKYGNSISVDGILVSEESPLYKNGKYFIVDQVLNPRPNLYEYFKENNALLRDYIDSQDSIVLDKEQSEPIGFDENGNTIYDTVSIIYNNFEEEYFPVKHELRDQTATIIFPKEEDYRNALSAMAGSMNIPDYIDYNDIPLDWQNRVLIPHLLELGVYGNMLEPEEFVWKSEHDTLKLKNIKGDSIPILFNPVEKTICSNGYAYNYQNFQIPDSLYNGAAKYEAERLLKETGVKKYIWNDSVNVISDVSFSPIKEFILVASNDSISRVLFTKGYSGKYSVEFKTQPLFPRKYLMVVNTHMDIGGLYEIYVNDELVKTFDYYDFVRYQGMMFSVTGERYFPEGRFNKFDMWVDNITEYGRPKIRFEYKSPSYVMDNGLVLDYIAFIPADL